MNPDYPYPVKKISLANDLEIAYWDLGKGDMTLVFVHGFASYAPTWLKNIENLQKYFRCVALDLPGHGLSSKGNFSYTQSFYVDTVKTWLQALGIQKSVLIGHSMGGQIAVKLALDYPQWFSHLVLVAPAGFETFNPTERLLLTQIASSGILGASQYLKLVLNLKNYFYDLNEKEYQKLQELSRDFYSWQENSYLPQILAGSIKGMLEEPIFEDLSKLNLPTLVFFGKNDQLIPNTLLHLSTSTETIAQTACAKIPNCQLKLYEKCGHFLQYEHPSQFNIDLYKFLNPVIFPPIKD